MVWINRIKEYQNLLFLLLGVLKFMTRIFMTTFVTHHTFLLLKNGATIIVEIYIMKTWDTSDLQNWRCNNFEGLLKGAWCMQNLQLSVGYFRANFNSNQILWIRI